MYATFMESICQEAFLEHRTSPSQMLIVLRLEGCVFYYIRKRCNQIKVNL